MLESEETYYYHSKIENAPIHPENSSCLFYEDKKKLLVFASISTATNQNQIKSDLIDVSLSNQSTFTLPNHFSSDNRIDSPPLIPQKNVISREEVEKKKLEQSKLLQEKKVIDYQKEEATYAQLYKEIELANKQGKITQANQQKNQPIKKNNIKRNDPCPCGSGKKFKNCHLDK